MNIDEFPSLDFLLPYTGNKLQTKLLLGAAGGLVFGIMLLFLAVGLVLRIRRNRRAVRSSELSTSSSGIIGGGAGASGGGGGGGGGSGIGGAGIAGVGDGLSSSSIGGGTAAGTLGVHGAGDMMGSMQSTLIGGGGGCAAMRTTDTATVNDNLMGTGHGGDTAKSRGGGGFLGGGTDGMDGFDTNPDIIPLKGNFDRRGMGSSDGGREEGGE